jgi:hypothetical protein
LIGKTKTINIAETRPIETKDYERDVPKRAILKDPEYRLYQIDEIKNINDDVISTIINNIVYNPNQQPITFLNPYKISFSDSSFNNKKTDIKHGADNLPVMLPYKDSVEINGNFTLPQLISSLLTIKRNKFENFYEHFTFQDI